MTGTDGLAADAFSRTLFEAMKRIDPAIEDLELYEFRYALESRFPAHRQVFIPHRRQKRIYRRFILDYA